MPYNVLLVDDHKILRDGIKAILRGEGDFDVVGEDGLADFVYAMQGLGTGSITLYGTDEQKRRFLPPVRAGGWRG